MYPMNTIRHVRFIFFVAMFLGAMGPRCGYGDDMVCADGFHRVKGYPSVINADGRTPADATDQIQFSGSKLAPWFQKCSQNSSAPHDSNAFDFQVGGIDVLYRERSDNYRASRPIVCCQRDEAFLN